MTKNEPLGNALSIRGKLHLLGWRSFDVWAQANGYKAGTVRTTVRTWGERTDRTPHGGISRDVMRDLRLTLAKNIRPTSTAPAADPALSMDLFSTPPEARG